MTRYQILAERAVVTFVEAAATYYAVSGSPTLNKTAIAGALGAGLSAVYNFLRESSPTINQTSTLNSYTAPVSTPPTAPSPSAEPVSPNTAPVDTSVSTGPGQPPVVTGTTGTPTQVTVVTPKDL